MRPYGLLPLKTKLKIADVKGLDFTMRFFDLWAVKILILT